MTGLFDFIKDTPPQSPQVFTFPNNGVVFDRLPSELYKDLMQALEDSGGWDMNPNLVGHIKVERTFPEGIPILRETILSLAKTHAQYFNHLKNYSILTADADMVIDPLWVNFQSKHEFNPPHGHEGVYSFVVWMKIPYDLEEEKSIFHSAKQSMTSMFGFITTDILGRSHVNPIPIDKSYEGVVCLFPSSLLHYVNPFFTTTSPRISISGNILLDAKR